MKMKGKLRRRRSAVQGIEQFEFPKPQTFVCAIMTPHLVQTNVIYLSDKKDGIFIYCSEHQDFYDVSYPTVSEGVKT